MDVQEAQQIKQYMDEVNGIVDGLTEKVASLAKENELLRNHAQKEASATFDQDGLEQTVDMLVKAGFIHANERQEALQKTASNPDVPVKWLGELARRSMQQMNKTASALGRVESPTTSTNQNRSAKAVSDVQFEQYFGRV